MTSSSFPTPYCELPGLDWNGWFGNLTLGDKWRAKYPLVDIEMLATAPYVVVNDGYMCSFGYSFLAESITSFLLFVVAVLCFARLQYSFPYSHHTRKVLFVLLAVVGLIRGVYNTIASHKVSQLEMYVDSIGMIPWFFKTNIPVNAVCDLLVGYIDFMLTFFWLDILYHRFVRSRLGIGLQVALFVASSVAIGATLGLDYTDVVVHREFNGGRIYHRTLSMLVFLFLVSGIMHMAVVVLLLRSMFRMTGDINVFLDRKMRWNILIVAIIGFVSAVCLLLRALVLMARLTWKESLVTGPFSLDNPTFTTVYYVLMMNLPCIVVAIAFAILTHKLIVDENRDLEENVGTRDSLLLSGPTPGNPTGGSAGTPGSPGELRGASVVRVGPRSPLVVNSVQVYRKQSSATRFQRLQTPVSVASRDGTSAAQNPAESTPSDAEVSSVWKGSPA